MHTQTNDDYTTTFVTRSSLFVFRFNTLYYFFLFYLLIVHVLLNRNIKEEEEDRKKERSEKKLKLPIYYRYYFVFSDFI